MKKLLSMCTAALAIALSAADNAVEPCRRYRAEFEIRATGKYYPQDWFYADVEVKYPNAELVLLTAGGKPVRTFRPMRFHAFSDQFTPGAIEFYTPEGAGKVSLKNNGTEIRSFHLLPVEAGKNLALPLDYRIGGQFVKTEITPGKDGSGIFDCTNGGIYFYPVPVEPGATYRLTVYGSKGYKPTGLVIRFSFSRNGSTKKGKISASREPMRINGKKKSFTTTFKVPENARWFHLFAMWGFVYDYKLEKIQ